MSPLERATLEQLTPTRDETRPLPAVDRWRADLTLLFRLVHDTITDPTIPGHLHPNPRLR